MSNALVIKLFKSKVQAQDVSGYKRDFLNMDLKFFEGKDRNQLINDALEGNQEDIFNFVLHQFNSQLTLLEKINVARKCCLESSWVPQMSSLLSKLPVSYQTGILLELHEDRKKSIQHNGVSLSKEDLVSVLVEKSGKSQEILEHIKAQKADYDNPANKEVMDNYTHLIDQIESEITYKNITNALEENSISMKDQSSTRKM